MILIPPCVRIYLQFCTIFICIASLSAESLVTGALSHDSTGRRDSGGRTRRFRVGVGDSLSYISNKRAVWREGPRIRSDLASQKHVLEKERYIRRKGPVGFQTVAVQEESNISNRTLEVEKKLKEKIPNATIQDIWNHFSYTGTIRKGVLSGRQLPAKNVKRPNYYDTGKPLYVKYHESSRGEDDNRGTIKTADEIAGIRRACRIAREILDFASAMVVEGFFTDDIDRYVHKLCAIKGVYPATLNYHGFPKSVCTSLNEVACHGIPDSNVLSAGDLLKLDLSIYCDGFFGDVCETYMVMPMKKDFNKKFSKTKYMGMFERNKLIYRSVKHSNLHGCEKAIVVQTSFIKEFTNAMKKAESVSGLLDLAKMIFTNETRLMFKFTSEKEMLKLATKLTQETRSIYENPNEPYDGRIVGLPASAIPAYFPTKELGNVFTTMEDPQIVAELINPSDEHRYNKPYLFSHTFDQDVELMRITHEALQKGISVCKPGAKISAIGKAIEKFLKIHNCKALSNLCGHGIGRNFHENPIIPHEVNDSDVVMEPGMVFTIEPIVTRSILNSFMMWPDGWTLSTLDGSKTAQFEHTVLITNDGHEVLTDKLPSSPPYFWDAPLEVMY